MAGLEDALSLSLQPLDHGPGRSGEAGSDEAREVRSPGLVIRTGQSKAHQLRARLRGQCGDNYPVPDLSSCILRADLCLL